MRRWHQSGPEWLRALLFFLLATLAFWKFRLIDPAGDAQVGIMTDDLYNEAYPMLRYGFEKLASGTIPLWNPYQLCGVPFLAIPYTGLFYPGNLPYLFFDAGWALEISLVAHLAFAALCMWLLARNLGFGVEAALAAALTFTWSGWMFTRIHQPSLLSGVCWLPATVLLIEHTVRGRRSSALWLTLAVTCQLLNGAVEVFVYNLYAGGLFALFRLARLQRDAGWAASGRRGAVLLGCVAAGVLLSAAQLAPSLELVEHSARAPGSLTLKSSLLWGATRPASFLLQALEGAHAASVGFLPLLGLAFGLDWRRVRNVWSFSTIAAFLAVLLAFGGAVYEVYFETPLGSMFRRPIKFLQIYAFAQALLAAIALQRLDAWRSAGTIGRSLWSTPPSLWASPGWIAGPLLACAGLYWLARHGTSNAYLAASLALLALFALVENRSLRRGVIAALLLLQSVSLFLAASNTYLRPAAQPQVFQRYDPLLGELGQALEGGRIYISPGVPKPGLARKQGLLKRLRVVNDNERLCSRRAATFFGRASGEAQPAHECPYALSPQARWPLMDLASTRYYVFRRGEAADRHLEELTRRSEASGFRLTAQDRLVSVYQRSRPLPRAYFVPRARVLPSSEAVLAALEAPGFDPRREVLLEAEAGVELPVRGTGGQGVARLLVDEPEEVVVEVQAKRPGFLVLTDAFYPGWRAYADGSEIALHRANYLFRAVSVPAGRTRVRFEYRPQSFRRGLWLSGATALALLAVVFASLRRPAPGGEGGG